MKIDNKTYIFRYKSKIGQEEVFHSFLDIQKALAFAEKWTEEETTKILNGKMDFRFWEIG